MSETLYYGITFIIVFAFVFILLLLIKHTRAKTSADYDERQELIRGKAYKCAFMFCLVFSLVSGLILEFSGTSFVSPGAALLITAFLGVMIFADCCIVKDAFYSLSQSRRWYVILCIIIIISTGISTIDTIHSGGFTGGLTFYNTSSPLCMILFLNILIVMAVKTVLSRREDANEES